ncbi:MAG TPA: phenylalanine 4-monooxygenase, partial [Micavibrio sp.]
MKDEYGNPMGSGESTDYTPYIIDQGWKNYTDEEHGTWEILYKRQRALLKDLACPEFLENLDRLGISDSKIPDFRRLSENLKELTGWEVVAVPGLIPDLPFFQMLAERKFPAGHFIRKRAQLDYIEEPDVFHDVFGHVPLLAHPVFADYLQAYGQGGLRAHESGTIKNLARLYWFTVEFGLINTAQGLRIFGAGILSSAGESRFALQDGSPHRIKFDLKRVMQTNYRVDDYQQSYFVIDSFEQLFKETYKDFGALYEEIKSNPRQLAPDEIVDEDQIIHRGTQAHAIAR